MLFKDRWHQRQAQEVTRLPLTGGEAWTIVSVCLLLVTFMCMVWSIETSRVTAAGRDQGRACRCSG
jgi:hypothetical protein